MIKIYDLKTEYLAQPNAVDVQNPRFSWKLSSDHQGVIQKSYHIQAVSGNEILWDSGVVESDECRFVRYEGEPLRSRQKVTWQVMVTAVDADGNILTAQREKANFQMGLLCASDWKAKWITAAEDAPGRRPAACLHRKFTVKRGLVEARIYQTAHGLYESFINGTITDADKFKPGLTSYYYRIQYQTYDITDLLHEGENAWNVTLADGWWRGSTGGSVINNWGRTLDYLGQIELTYEDGTTEIIGTDEHFETATGPLLASDMLMGDIYDARLIPESWHPVRLGITFPSTSSVHNPAEIAQMKKSNPLYEIAGPSGDGNRGEDATGWGDAAAWLPWSVYQWYGDKTILENQYETAKKWLEFELRCAKEPNPMYAELAQYKDGCGEYIFDTRFHYGEWNEAFGIREKVEEYYRNPPEPRVQTAEDKLKAAAMVNYFIDMKAKAGDAVVATAYMARTAGNVAEMAAILGKTEEAAHYAALAEKIRQVYAKYLIAEDGTIQPRHQAPYVRALAMDLCGSKKDQVLHQLLTEVKNNGFASRLVDIPQGKDCT